jgi:hypothetical protein
MPFSISDVVIRDALHGHSPSSRSWTCNRRFYPIDPNRLAITGGTEAYRLARAEIKIIRTPHKILSGRPAVVEVLIHSPNLARSSGCSSLSLAREGGSDGLDVQRRIAADAVSD